jgi:hypothetical protein
VSEGVLYRPRSRFGFPSPPPRAVQGSLHELFHGKSNAELIASNLVVQQRVSGFSVIEAFNARQLFSSVLRRGRLVEPGLSQSAGCGVSASVEFPH